MMMRVVVVVLVVLLRVNSHATSKRYSIATRVYFVRVGTQHKVGVVLRYNIGAFAPPTPPPPHTHTAADLHTSPAA